VVINWGTALISRRRAVAKFSYFLRGKAWNDKPKYNPRQSINFSLKDSFASLCTLIWALNCVCYIIRLKLDRIAPNPVWSGVAIRLLNTIVALPTSDILRLSIFQQHSIQHILLHTGKPWTRYFSISNVIDIARLASNMTAKNKPQGWAKKIWLCKICRANSVNNLTSHSTAVQPSVTRTVHTCSLKQGIVKSFVVVWFAIQEPGKQLRWHQDRIQAE
jgi:hypothetical protein